MSKLVIAGCRLLLWMENYHAGHRQVRLLVTKGHQRYG